MSEIEQALAANNSNNRDLTPIKAPYLLLTRIVSYEDESGNIWLDRLWYQDLNLHTLYIHSLFLMGPRAPVKVADEIDLVRLDSAAGSHVTVLDVYAGDGLLRFLPRPIRAAANIISVLQRVAAVQPGDIGWPIGWLGCLLGKIFGKKIVIVVESAPWRHSSYNAPRLKRRLVATVKERIVRFLTNRSNLAIFTHPTYRDALLQRKEIPHAVIPASWISAHDVLESEVAIARSVHKRFVPPRRFLFAARLTEEKGIDILLKAVDFLVDRGAVVEIDIIGEGPKRSTVAAVAGTRAGVILRLLDPMPYGKVFFDFLGSYDMLLVPNLADEQPRIVFDAYSQAVPVIASDTVGLKPYVEHGRTGWLFETGNPTALADAVVAATAAPADIAAFGLESLSLAMRHTHLGMHAQRSLMLARIL